MEIRKADRQVAMTRARNLNPELFDRVMIHSGQPSECWSWQGGKDKDGYGVFKLGGKSIKAHRAVASLFYPQPQPVVRHICNNPACVNPTHLRPGTQLDNAQDRVAAGRGGDLAGVRNGRAKLNDEQAKEIRDSSETGASLARRFGISKVMACKIRRGAAWSHITN